MGSKLLIAWLLLIGVSGCTPKQDAQKVVAKVNNYTITVDDFNHETGLLRPVFRNLSSIPPIELKLSILDEMINRELLLEEAQKINLDKDPEFMRQIENFWRLSLIKELFRRKMAEIKDSTSVSPQEIQEEYARERKQMPSLGPLPAVAEQIKEIIFQRKVQNGLQAWEDSLKTKATIKRYYGVLNAVAINGQSGGGR